MSVRILSFDDPPKPSDVLRKLADYAGDADSDKYMEGEIFDRLETRISELLGKPAAVWMPSGKLAQMAALRSLADRARCHRVAMHPRSHFEEYEARAYSELWGLRSHALGEFDRPTEARDLKSISEELGAVTIELPLRRLGCLLPSWNELREISTTARKMDVFIHLDGARIWESQPYYGKELSEIAGLFDTVYVAFDKGLGGLSGGALVGPEWLVEQSRIWQRRAGGRALRSFPAVLSALHALDVRLPMMAQFHDKAIEIAALFEGYDEFSVSPFPPHANAFNVTFRGNETVAFSARDTVAKECGISIFEQPFVCADQNLFGFEVTIRGAGARLYEHEIEGAIGRFHRELFRRQS